MNTQLESLLELGEVLLENNGTGHHILFLSVIGEIEGHHLSSDRIKTTKYEHLLPLLTQVQDNQEIDGLFLLINTVGGDCSCGLAAAEMIASIKKPTVSLVIGDSHSIGVPLSVAADRTFIAPTATMILHPVRLNGTIIGAPQTFEYFRLIQGRIVTFVEAHTGVAKSRLERMMIRQGMMVKDLGTILVGKWRWKKELLMKLVVFLKRFSGCIRRLKEAGRKDRRKNDRRKNVLFILRTHLFF